MPRSLGLGFVFATTLLFSFAFGNMLRPVAENRHAADAVGTIEKALGAATEVQYLDTPLTDVVDDLQLRHQVAIEIDMAALNADGKTPETTFTLTLRDVSLAAALNHLLAPQGLCWLVDDERLLITTKAAAAAPENFTTRVYPVGELLPADAAGEPDDLVELVRHVLTMGWTDWADSGANTFARYHARTRSLVVTAPYPAQRQIAGLLAALQRIRTYEAQSDATVGLAFFNDAARNRALREPTETEFVDTPLSDVVTYLQLRHHVPVLLDLEALAADGKGPETPCTFASTKASLASTLNRLTDQLGLAWTVRDEVLMLTTPVAATAPEHLLVQFYSMKDLIDADGDDESNLSALIETLETTRPSHWQSHGGYAWSQSFAPTQTLIVGHTSAGHRAVADLLRQLRNLPKTKSDETPPLLTTKFYPISDLVAGYRVGENQALQNGQSRFAEDAKPLVATLRQNAAPESWAKEEPAGERPSITIDTLTQSFVVRQTAKGHRAVRAFLQQVRRDLYGAAATEQGNGVF
jgi:hypothetical protein